MKHYYRVAELLFSLTIDDQSDIISKLTNYEPFIVDNITDEKDVVLSDELLFELEVKEWNENIGAMATEQRKTTPSANYDEEDKILSLYQLPNKSNKISDYNIYFFSKLSRKDNLGLLEATDNFRKGTLYSYGTKMARNFALNNALMMLFAFAGSSRGVLLQHASVIKKGGLGYCFLGVSGTGKSTHSQLWLNNIENTELLNDDNPAIRFDNQGIPFVFGTPWSGKTPCYKNDRARLGGFVNLKQAPHNKIRELSPLESYIAILPTFSNINWEKSIADNLHSVVDKLVKKVKVVELECLPDADAALLSYSTLTNRKIETAKGYEIFDSVTKVVNEGKSATIRVFGNSMLPFIISGRDSVELKKFDEYKKGDIVLAKYFTKDDNAILVKYVLHRIMEINGKYAILQGDGNHKSVKEKVLRNNIIGKVITIYFNGKRRDTDSTWQQLKYKGWLMLKPFRRVLLALYRRLYSNKRSVAQNLPMGK